MSKSFKSRVDNFWKTFCKEEHLIREMMDNKVQGETLLDFVDNILKIMFDNAYFEMGINKENKYELILTPEGSRAKLFLTHYWLQYAPEKLFEKWNFYSSKPAHTGWEQFDMYNITIKSEDVTIYPEIDTERKKVNIEIYAPKFMELDEDSRYNMFFVYLDRFIGELYTMEYIGYIDFVEEKKDAPSVEISHLLSFINDAIKNEEWVKINKPTELYSMYRLNPKEEAEWKLREDVSIGMTSCIPAINAYLQNNNEFFDNFDKNGAIFGFLFFENINVPKENIVAYRGDIEDKITAITIPQGIADPIGGATGFHFSYIDFIIYDLEAFIPIAKDMMSNYNFEEFGFCRFGDMEHPIFFK